MEPRKLVKAGTSSTVVSLPKGWIKQKGLSFGDVVYVSQLNDGSIRITSDETKIELPETEVTIEIGKKDITEIKREITSAYLKNYNTIHVTGELSKVQMEIRKLIHDFVAFEITEQTSSRITSKDLLNRSEVSVEKTIRRMDMTVRSMLLDLFKEPISVRDHDVNRMYFLLNKLLKHAVTDHTVAKQINVEPSEILLAWDTSTALESIADDAVALSKTKKSKAAMETHEKLRKQYEQAVGAYFTDKKNDAQEVLNKRTETLEELKKLPAGQKELFTSLLNGINSIARVALDR
jgi:phosphate uptake regulator